MGFEVEIVALQKGDTQNTHADWAKYNLAARTRWFQDEPTGKVAKLRLRASQTLRGIHRKNTWQALNLKRYGAESRNLILSAICGQVATPFHADVFIAHFGPAGVTAAKLRELGVIRGKIATIFHGIDISSREVLNHYTPEYQQLFRRGDRDTQNTHADWAKYNLAARTRWFQDEPTGKVAKLRLRASQTLRGIHRKNTWQALNLKRYGAESRNLILSAICGQVATPFHADVFIAHFGPAGVTAAKLRELGVIRGKIATIFHGIDISSREVLNHYTPEYQQLFRRGDLMLPISDLWAGRLQKMGCPREKIAV